ncbi:ATPase [Indibacter alkaliphilus LW1]|uniref:ATPase n=1 Tax=Indibacter alkaliphilus (strain CCUG 57479 / KCTC 22604 / LW1) TaxID=1189612 RepID=S2DP48_INDAL|nr:ATP-binding protein [Indibacter alkaliphilus]EOZ93746.1 ATPase [Indibacter alkaliphilus LW1]
MVNRNAYIEKLRLFIGKPQIKIITGIRRSGKSTVLKLLTEELIKTGVKDTEIIYLNFESFTNSHLTSAKSLYEDVKRKINTSQKYYLLLDEIQEVHHWEKAVNSFLVDFDVDIYITGSNSHLLSSELSTFLAGRYIEIPIYTLSFDEFLDFKKSYSEIKENKHSLFVEYLRKGGFPVIHTMEYEEETAYQVVSDIYDSVILRDTVQRHKIRDIELLNRVIQYAFDNLGNTFSGKNVADYFKSQQRKIDINTVYNYLSALESAFILYRVPRYDLKGKEILKTQEKFFLADISLLYATMGYRDRMISGVLENLVFLELRRRGFKVFIGKFDNKEIDFVAEKKSGKIYIQVAYKLESQATIDREFSALHALRDHYPKYVVTMDDFFSDTIKGVKHMHICDFLLAKYWQ